MHLGRARMPGCWRRKLNSLAISTVCFICIFSGALFGLFLRKVLPGHHLTDETKDSVKIGISLIATLTALVLGLLVSSAKSNFDTMSAEVTHAGAKILLLNNILHRYGPEAGAARDSLRQCLAGGLSTGIATGQGDESKLQDFERRSCIQDVHDILRRLAPRDDYQRQILEQARNLVADLTQIRWLIIEQHQGALPEPFLITLIFWLMIFFVCFGMLTEANATVVTVMLVCALSMSGAIFLILEMGNPIDGIIKLSFEPLRHALLQMGK